MEIDILVEAKRLDESISIVEMLGDSLLKDKAKIKVQEAQLLFDNRQFCKSVDRFYRGQCSP